MNEYVESKVGLPGLLLALFGFLVGLLNLIWFGYTVVMLGLALSQGADPAVVLVNSGTSLVLQVFAMMAGLLQIVAGLRLRSARSPMLVYAGALSAMLPCCSGGCCCVGFAIGAWALVAVQDDQVKAAFSEP